VRFTLNTPYYTLIKHTSTSSPIFEKPNLTVIFLRIWIWSLEYFFCHYSVSSLFCTTGFRLCTATFKELYKNQYQGVQGWRISVVGGSFNIFEYHLFGLTNHVVCSLLMIIIGEGGAPSIIISGGLILLTSIWTGKLRSYKTKKGGCRKCWGAKPPQTPWFPPMAMRQDELHIICSLLTSGR